MREGEVDALQILVVHVLPPGKRALRRNHQPHGLLKQRHRLQAGEALLAQTIPDAHIRAAVPDELRHLRVGRRAQAEADVAPLGGERGEEIDQPVGDRQLAAADGDVLLHVHGGGDAVKRRLVVKQQPSGRLDERRALHGELNLLADLGKQRDAQLVFQRPDVVAQR